MQLRSNHLEMTPCNSQAPEFQVEGSIVYSTRPRPRQPSSNQFSARKDFVVFRKGHQWKIRTANNQNNPNTSDCIQFQEMGCDGSNVFELQQMDQDKVRQSNDEKDTISVLGRVRRGAIPSGLDSDLIFPLWLAYCSSDYFLTRKDDRIVAPLFKAGNFLTGAAPQPQLLSAQWKTNDATFVSEVAWYSDGNFLVEGDGSRRFERYLPPFDKAFLHASFETAQWADFSGMFLPGAFELKVFAPTGPERAEANCDLFYAIEATAQAIQPLKKISPLPELTRKALITDTRYRLGDCAGCCLAYGSSSRWDTEEEVEAKLKSREIKYDKQTPQG